jgi:hypothetical protein
VQLSANHWNSGATCEPGHGDRTTVRAFLGEDFFADLARMQIMGAERIVFGFSV